MSRIVAATSDRVKVRPDEDLAFWDLVCADDEWLRAEFDAIVTSEYPQRCGPDHDQPAAARRPDPLGRARHSPARPHRPVGTDAPLRTPPRQRSPPPRDARTPSARGGDGPQH